MSTNNVLLEYITNIDTSRLFDENNFPDEPKDGDRYINKKYNILMVYFDGEIHIDTYSSEGKNLYNKFQAEMDAAGDYTEEQLKIKVDKLNNQ